MREGANRRPETDVRRKPEMITRLLIAIVEFSTQPIEQ